MKALTDDDAAGNRLKLQAVNSTTFLQYQGGGLKMNSF
jgi:hypothetical protein